MQVTNFRIPGPTPIPPAIMRAMQPPMISHRGAAFRKLHLGLVEKLREIHKTRGDIFIMPGSGSVGWEAAIVNTLRPGDKVLAFVTGDFGHRFASVAERFGLRTKRVSVEPGYAVTPELAQAHLDRHPDARAILFTWNETSTGVTNPLQEIGPLARRHGALLLVDAVSAAGAIPLEMDAWGADIVMSGSQKAWMCPPGLAILAVGERVRQAEQRATFPRSFLDFERWRGSVMSGDTPATAPLSLYYGLDAASDMILSEGLERRAERHERAAVETRRALREAAFDLLAGDSHASITVTAAVPPNGQSARELVAEVRKRYDIEVATGQGDLADAIIRIGHMGWFREADMARVTAAVVACSQVAEKVG